VKGLASYLIWWPFIFVFAVAWEAAERNKPNQDREEEATTDRQRQAEQGDVTEGSTVHSPNSTPPESSESRPWYSTHSFLLVFYKAFFESCVLIARPVVPLVWRSTLVGLSLGVYTFNWVEYQIFKKNDKRILMIAYGLANFVVAAVYYLALFEPKGTIAPQWANIFGR
jgi:hypothetical protein